MALAFLVLYLFSHQMRGVWSKPVGESQRSRLNNHLLVGVVLQFDQLLLTTPWGKSTLTLHLYLFPECSPPWLA